MCNKKEKNPLFEQIMYKKLHNIRVSFNAGGSVTGLIKGTGRLAKCLQFVHAFMGTFL